MAATVLAEGAFHFIQISEGLTILAGPLVPVAMLNHGISVPIALGRYPRRHSFTISRGDDFKHS